MGMEKLPSWSFIRIIKTDKRSVEFTCFLLLLGIGFTLDHCWDASYKCGNLTAPFHRVDEPVTILNQVSCPLTY